MICFVCHWYVQHFTPKLTDRWIYHSSSRQVFCSFPNLRGVNGHFFCWKVSPTAGVHKAVEAPRPPPPDSSVRFSASLRFIFAASCPGSRRNRRHLFSRLKIIKDSRASWKLSCLALRKKNEGFAPKWDFYFLFFAFFLSLLLFNIFHFYPLCGFHASLC